MTCKGICIRHRAQKPAWTGRYPRFPSFDSSLAWDVKVDDHTAKAKYCRYACISRSVRHAGRYRFLPTELTSNQWLRLQ